MEFPAEDVMHNTADAKQLLAEAKAALEAISSQLSGTNLDPETAAAQLQAAILHAQSAVEQAGNCLDTAAVQGETEQRYSAIFEKSPFALALTKMPEATLVSVNDAFLALFEFTRQEVIGKTSLELNITDPDARRQVAAQFQKNGQVKDFECTRRTKSGSELFLSLSLEKVPVAGDNYVLTTVRDITAHKQADKARAQSLSIADTERKRLSAVMEALPIGVAIVDDKGGNIQANQAFEAVWGSPRPPADGVNDYTAYKAWWIDSNLPVKPEEWASAQAVQLGKTVVGQVMRIQKFDGTFAYVHNSAAPIFDTQGKVIGCAVAIQDITRLQSRESEVNQLNRTLKALSSSNQAMLHAETEQQFLTEVCRIITEDCGFALAWIGYAENNKLKTVRPVASSGFDQGYLDQMNISWANNPHGRGPTGTAIRTKKPSRCNNMLTDPKFAPWRQAAVERGYASSLVLPLLANGRAFGALNIYSRQPEGFSDEEEKLLVELAGDLAYGITTLRVKADQAIAEAALHESEERYRTIVETASEGVALVSPQGTYTYVNKRMCEMLGYDASEILGWSSIDFADPYSLEQIHQAQMMLARGESLHGELKFRRKDGSTLWSLYNASPMYNENGEHVANLSMHTDITERKSLEEHLAYLATFPEKNPRPIVELDLQGSIRYANPAALNQFPDIRKKMLSHQYLAGWDSVITALNQDPSGAVTRDVAVGDRYYEQTLNLIPGQGLVRIYGMDITERKLANQALLDAREALEQRVLQRTEELNIANEQLRAEVAERQRAQVELESTVQELQVIEEELRNNNEILIDAQKVLETERQRYQDLFDYAPDGYLVTNNQGVILEANQHACRMLVIAHRHLIDKPLTIFIAKMDHPVFFQLLSTLHKTQQVQSFELRLINRNRAEFTSAVTVAAAKDHSGMPVLRWTLRDITESKTAQEIIRQNFLRNEVLAELSQSLTEASLDEKAILNIVSRTIALRLGDSCVIHLASGDGLQLNPVAWHALKPDHLQILDSIFTESYHPSKDGLAWRVYQSSQPLSITNFDINSVKNIPSELRTYVDRIGIAGILVVPLQIGTKNIGTISLIRDSDGQPYSDNDQSLLEMIAYRTAQTIHNARMYRELQDSMLKELETHTQLVQAEKFAAVGRLLASITHEINNPLQTIKNCLYLSQLDTPQGTPSYDAIAMAVAETNRLSNLVAQLREIYRPPTSGLNRPVNIPTLLSEVQTLLAGYLQEKFVSWELDPSSAKIFDNLVIEGVSEQLKQVFLNICLNAIDAMEPKGGKIMIELKLSDDGRQAGIRLRDSGPGLPQEVKEKLFEPFVTTKEKGLGLGLVICYDIIQKHNGSIEVESEPGEGAAFTVWLPAREGDG